MTTTTTTTLATAAKVASIVDEVRYYATSAEDRVAEATSAMGQAALLRASMQWSYLTEYMDAIAARGPWATVVVAVSPGGHQGPDGCDRCHGRGCPPGRVGRPGRWPPVQPVRVPSPPIRCRTPHRPPRPRPRVGSCRRPGPCSAPWTGWRRDRQPHRDDPGGRHPPRPRRTHHRHVSGLPTTGTRLLSPRRSGGRRPAVLQPGTGMSSVELRVVIQKSGSTLDTPVMSYVPEAAS